MTESDDHLTAEQIYYDDDLDDDPRGPPAPLVALAWLGLSAFLWIAAICGAVGLFALIWAIILGPVMDLLR